MESPFHNQLRAFLPRNNDSFIFQEELLTGTDDIAKFVFDKEYNSFLAGYHPFIQIFKNQRLDLVESNALINKFCRDSSFEQIWKQYPHLASILTEKVESNKRALDIILNSLEQDAPQLKLEFGLHDLTVKSIKIGKGDVHQNGQSTTIITFNDDQRVIFKPRSAGLDIAFNKLIESFNTNNPSLSLRTTKFIDRETYSWCEFITNEPCASLDQVKEYYTKAGVLIALMYLLQGVDIHFENIIAHGSSPVIIDLECLFNHTDLNYFNVLTTGMCPILTLNGFEGTAVNLSGMGATGNIKMEQTSWKWKNSGNDALNLEKVHGYLKANGNQPVYNDQPISPENYLEQVLSGFDEAFDWIQTVQNQIRIDEHNPLDAFQNQTFRIIPRITQVYTAILENSFTPDALGNKLCRRATIENDLSNFPLNAPFVNQEGKNRLLESERIAIERMDIPYFNANTSSRYLRESDQIILDDYFKVTPYEVILNKVMKFNQQDVNDQKKLIKSSIVSTYNLKLNQPILNRPFDHSRTTNPSYEFYIEEIKRIADSIIDSIVIEEGDINWYCFKEESDAIIFSLLESSLYSGKIGVALFLANMSKGLEIEKYDEIIDAIFKTEITAYKDSHKRASISFSSGLTGLLHALMEIDPDKYTDVALKLSSHITISLIEEDTVFDIMGGSAGCLKTLCKLYQISSSTEIMNKCIKLGEHLLDKRIIDPVSQKRCWISISGEPLAGYSHGAAGIGLSLLSLYEISGIEKFKDAFYETLDFENYYFVDSQKNWKDLRNKDGKFQNSWCHGATGIGLARIEAYKILGDENLLKDIIAAIEGTRNEAISTVDHFCCGKVGRIEFLIEASTLLPEIELEDSIHQQIKSLVTAKNKIGHYKTFQNSNVSVENPSLYRGTSGIGQTLLNYCQKLGKLKIDGSLSKVENSYVTNSPKPESLIL